MFWRIPWHVIPKPRITLRFSPHFIYFCFFNGFWALTSGGFRVVSDTLVSFGLLVSWFLWQQLLEQFFCLLDLPACIFLSVNFLLSPLRTKKE